MHINIKHIRSVTMSINCGPGAIQLNWLLNFNWLQIYKGVGINSVSEDPGIQGPTGLYFSWNFTYLLCNVFTLPCMWWLYLLLSPHTWWAPWHSKFSPKVKFFLSVDNTYTTLDILMLWRPCSFLLSTAGVVL